MIAPCHRPCCVASIVLVSLAACVARAAGSAPAPLPRGHVALAADFDAGLPAGWTGAGTLVPGRDGAGRAIRFSAAPAAPAARPASTVGNLPLPIERLRGHVVRISADVRIEDISAKPDPWNGVKLMLVIQTPSGPTYPQASIGVGAADWKRISFRHRIPDDARSATLVLGLERVSGTATFDDLRITVLRPPAVAPAVIPPTRRAPHVPPRLRGAMISPNIDEAGLRTLGQEWGANLIRWQLIQHGRGGRALPLDQYDSWLEGELKKLDAALPLCRKYGLMVALDLHSPPGGKPTSSGYVGSDAGLFNDKAAQAKFIDVWKKMAARYKGNDVIWAFDLANEPVEDEAADDCDDWQTLAERAARAIRAIDPDRTLIVEPAEWGGPRGLLSLVPLDLPNIVYSVHMYIPHAFTHQRLNGQGPSYTYPGEIRGQRYDKAALERELQVVVDWQKKYGVPIYIGEFSAIRWAPDGSAARYLSDVIEIFESHGWDWSYHAFREWHGWSVEHGPTFGDNKPAPEPTDRQKLLRSWFAKNALPAWK